MIGSCSLNMFSGLGYRGLEHLVDSGLASEHLADTVFPEGSHAEVARLVAQLHQSTVERTAHPVPEDAGQAGTVDRKSGCVRCSVHTCL